MTYYSYYHITPIAKAEVWQLLQVLQSLPFITQNSTQMNW